MYVAKDNKKINSRKTNEQKIKSTCINSNTMAVDSVKGGNWKGLAVGEEEANRCQNFTSKMKIN